MGTYVRTYNYSHLSMAWLHMGLLEPWMSLVGAVQSRSATSIVFRIVLSSLPWLSSLFTEFGDMSVDEQSEETVESKGGQVH